MMKRCLAAIALLLGGCATPAPRTAGDAAAVESAARTFAEAWGRNDLGALEALLDEDYRHTDWNGRVFDRAGWLAYVKERAERRVTNTVSTEDVLVSMHGDVGIVTGQNTITMATATGGTPLAAASTARIRFTQIWRARPDRTWKRLRFQATPIVEAAR